MSSPGEPLKPWSPKGTRPSSGARPSYGQTSRKKAPKKDNRIRNAVIVLVAIVVVAFGVGWNPPHNTTHSFSTASNYNQAKESGCTNSGAGCHGRETKYTDFNDYHPNAKCTTCHDYTGVACIPCHAPNTNHECPLCHDGSMKKAPDVVRITDNYPNGHYRETTHTAMGTDFDQPVQATPDGKASATCSQCHARSLRTAHTGVPVVAGSTYGSDLGCGECHNDVRSNGQAQVVAKWKSRTCEACHKVGSSSPEHSKTQTPAAHATDSTGCADSGTGCHDGDDLHALHADAPTNCSGSAKKGEPTCHSLDTNGLAPSAKTCGSSSADSCHRAAPGGTYKHKNALSAHSPDNGTPAAVVIDGTTCGACHAMAPDGRSLITEHARATAASTNSSDACRNCHNAPASQSALDDKWAARNDADACSACHGHTGLAGAHGADVSAAHTIDSGSEGCASSGPGCHPTSDIASVGTPTTTSGLHTTCLRCHSRTTYAPDATTCGAGRTCHNTTGAYDPATSAHQGNDSDNHKHDAGRAQAAATYTDLTTGVSTPCGSCHQMKLGSEHARVSSKLSTAENPCIACHNAVRSPEVVKSEWPKRNESNACAGCHPTSGSGGVHAGIDSSHTGMELGVDGLPAKGACATAGCHSTTDLRRLHRSAGCTATGCHSAEGDINGRNVRSCGGGNGLTACHPGYSASNHFVSHGSDLTGTVNGVNYSEGRNVGCFGCHASDLLTEHARELEAGTVIGGGTGCTVCHAEADDASANVYASTPAVRAAIRTHDLRCATCHASGSDASNASAVASAHKDISDATPLPPGKVWADPADDWKAALNATTGGGHNGLPASVVGADGEKQFPVVDFVVGGSAYRWSLPLNSGATAWLKPSVLGTAAVETTASIQHIRVGCSDCHAMPSSMAGPHGSTVSVGIDPDYSQTEYSDPTPGHSQFQATGTQRVVCMKCHQMEASADGSLKPGGAALHARHVIHDDLPTSDSHRYGETCIDCHVRIPHAWKRPRLLVRTVVTTDGVTPDVYPYIPKNYDGLSGMVLRNFTVPSDMRSRYCTNGGCHASHSAGSHPRPSDVPTATYWP